MKRHSSRLGLAMVMLSLVGGAASGQVVRGTAALPDSTTPASGVLIEARDARGQVVARALAGENGAFELRLPSAGEYDLRGLRVGFRPSLGDHVAVAAGQTVTSTLIFTGQALSLAAIAVHENRQCRISSDDGQLVSVLWGEVKTALASSQLAAPDGEVTSNWKVTDLVTDVRGRLVVSEASTDHSGRSDQPFGSIPADSLASVGYVSYRNGANEYDAPDALVLLSPSFAASHCFHIVKAHPKHPELIGLAFDPLHDRRGFIDIVGTLWLDRATSELRRLDYQYTELPRAVNDVDPGGWVEFMHLASGPWFISRWSIRMPRVTRYRYDDLTVPLSANERDVPSRLVVDAVQTRSGVVTSVQRGNLPLFVVATGASSTELPDASVGSPSLCAGSEKSLVFGRVLDSKSLPVPNATVSFAWRDHVVCRMDGSCKFDAHEYSATANEAGGWYVCGVPRGLPLTVKVQRGNDFFRRFTMSIESEQPAAKVDIPVFWPE